MNKVIANLLATFLVSSSLLSCAPQVKKIVEEKKEEVKVVKKEIPLYPVPKKVPEQKNYTGETYTDDYAWLRNKENPEVIAHLEAENKHTEMMMKSTESLQDSLFKEMVARIKEDDSSVPQKIADYYYYSRTEQGKQYRIYCRKGKLATAKEEITLDLNTLVKGDFLALGDYKVSPNQKLLAYTLDNNGSEAYDLYIKNLETGELFKEVIPNTSGNIEWSSDNKTIFYSTLDAAKRPFKVFKHKLATEIEKDTLVYHEADESYYLGISKTKNGAYILLNSGSQITSEVRFINATKPDEMPKVVTKREYGVEYSVENRDNKFFIVTNKEAINFKLVVTPIDKPSAENWKEVIPAWETIKIDDFQVFKDHIVVLEREAALKKILLINLKNFESKYIEFEEPVYNVELAKNPEYTSPNLRFTYESLTTPESVFEYEFATGKKNLLKRQEVLGGYDPSNYEAERGFASSPDGVTVPISIVHKKGLEKNGNNPVYLYAYGSYGSNMDPYFSSARLSLLDRGFVFAIAHIRGGGDLGRRWYEDGKFLKKKNTFVDFISSAEYLIKENYTSKDKLVISGGSAGGLLMGAVTNMRPDLFKGVVADVPFVDVINTMMDPTLPLTVIEYDEWGNPNQKEYYDYMKSYSPYDNVKAQAYPNMLVTAGLNDPRVGYWEPAKFVAKIREMRTDKNLIMLKTNMGAGHGGASGRYDYLKDTAFEYAFALKVTGGLPETIATPVPSETPAPIATPIPTPSAN
jgi:oligopeptidase B